MTITKEGTLASFYTVNKAPIKHLRVYFSPKQAGEGDPSPENVREIEGLNKIELYHTGKNLCSAATGEEMLEKWLSNGAGKEQKIIGLPINQIFTLSTYVNKDFGENISNCRLYLYGALTSGQFLNTATPIGFKSRTGYPTSDGTLTIGHNRLGLTNYQVDLKNTQLEVGSVATKYEPYHGQTHTLDWSNDIGTIYGGYVDLVTGELVQEWKVWDVDDINFNRGNPDNYNNESGQRFSYAFPVGNINDFSDDINNIAICNILPTVKTTNSSTAVQRINWISVYKGWGQNTIYGCINDNLLNGSSIEDIKTFLRNNNFQVAIKLATPITHQLTPIQLQTLLGQNNIWSNADRVEVEYDLAESNDELYRRRNIILRSAPHIETASGNIAHFETDIAAPIKSAKISFSPVQEGSGDPSPENVRVISGWNNISIGHSTKNLIMYPLHSFAYEAGTTIRPLNGFNSIIPIDNGIKITPQNSSTGMYCLLGYVFKDKIYTLSWNTDFDSTNSRYRVEIRTNREFYEPTSEYEYLFSSNWKYKFENNPYIFTANTDGWLWINFHQNTTASEFTISNIQLEEGNVKTSFEQTTIFPLNWQTIAGTIYGGYADLVTGEVVITRIATNMREYVDIVNAEMVYNNMVRYKAPYLCSSKAISTHFIQNPSYNWGWMGDNVGNYCQYAYGSIGFSSSSLGLTTKEEWSAWLKENNVIVVGNLNTPIHYQLSPVQLKTLRGQNNIWSNANGPVDIQYYTH